MYLLSNCLLEKDFASKTSYQLFLEPNTLPIDHEETQKHPQTTETQAQGLMPV